MASVVAATVASGASAAVTPNVLLPLSPTSGQIKVSTQGNHHDSPDVARDAQGDFVVAWTLPGTDAEVWARRFGADGAPKGEMFMVANEVAYVGAARVAVDEDGDFAVVWDQGNITGGDAYDVYARRYDRNGVAQGDAFLVSTGTTGNQVSPDVAVDDVGNMVVVWAGEGLSDADSYGIYAKRYDNFGRETHGITQINADAGGYQANPRIGMSGGGDGVVVWGDDPSSSDASLTGALLARRLTRDTTTPSGSAIEIDGIVQYVNGAASAVDVAADTGFVVGWRDLRGTLSGVWHFDAFWRHVDAAGVLDATQTQANVTTAKDQENVQVAINDAGTRWAVGWTSDRPKDDGSGSSAHLRTFSAAGSSADLIASETTVNDQRIGAVAMDRDGAIAATWINETPATGGLPNDKQEPYVRLFDAIGQGPVTRSGTGVGSVLAAAQAEAGPAGQVPIVLSCPPQRVDCAFDVRGTVLDAPDIDPLVLGRRSHRVAAGRTASAEVLLSAPQRARLERAGRLRIRLTVVAGLGARRRTTERVVTVRRYLRRARATAAGALTVQVQGPADRGRRAVTVRLLSGRAVVASTPAVLVGDRASSVRLRLDAARRLALRSRGRLRLTLSVVSRGSLVGDPALPTGAFDPPRDLQRRPIEVLAG